MSTNFHLSKLFLLVLLLWGVYAPVGLWLEEGDDIMSVSLASEMLHEYNHNIIYHFHVMPHTHKSNDGINRHSVGRSFMAYVHPHSHVHTRYSLNV